MTGTFGGYLVRGILALITAALLTAVLTATPSTRAWLTEQQAASSFEASAVVKLDPAGRHARHQEQFGDRLDRVVIIRDELQAAKDRTALRHVLQDIAADGTTPASDWLDDPIDPDRLTILPTVDGKGIKITARDSDSDLATSIANGVAENFARRRNASRNDELRSLDRDRAASKAPLLSGPIGADIKLETTGSQVANISLPPVIAKVHAELHAERSASAALLAKLRDLSAHNVRIEDLANIDGTSNTVYLLQEKAAHLADIAALDESTPARAAKAMQLVLLNRGINDELALLVNAEEERHRGLKNETERRLPADDGVSPSEGAVQDPAATSTLGPFAVLDRPAEKPIARNAGLHPATIIALICLLATIFWLILVFAWRIKPKPAPDGVYRDPYWPLGKDHALAAATDRSAPLASGAAPASAIR